VHGWWISAHLHFPCSPSPFLLMELHSPFGAHHAFGVPIAVPGAPVDLPGDCRCVQVLVDIPLRWVLYYICTFYIVPTFVLFLLLFYDAFLLLFQLVILLLSDLWLFCLFHSWGLHDLLGGAMTVTHWRPIAHLHSPVLITTRWSHHLFPLHLLILVGYLTAPPPPPPPIPLHCGDLPHLHWTLCCYCGDWSILTIIPDLFPLSRCS